MSDGYLNSRPYRKTPSRRDKATPVFALLARLRFTRVMNNTWFSRHQSLCVVLIYGGGGFCLWIHLAFRNDEGNFPPWLELNFLFDSTRNMNWY